jgi:hypothetical protein
MALQGPRTPGYLERFLLSLNSACSMLGPGVGILLLVAIVLGMICVFMLVGPSNLVVQLLTHTCLFVLNLSESVSY